MKTSIQLATRRLTLAINNMLAHVDRAWEQTVPFLNHLKHTSNLIWILGFLTTLVTLIISLILSGGLFLGIIHAERAAKITFIIGATCISFGSIALAIYTIFIMLIGGHGEVFLCRPLYDAPNFQVVSKLFDRPGLVYENETIDGVIGDILYVPDNDKPFALNVSLAKAIDQCERNEPSYSVFRIERLINVSQILDLNEYDELTKEIEVCV